MCETFAILTLKMHNLNPDKSLTKWKLIVKMFGLGLLGFGTILGIVLFLAGSANLTAVIVCGGLIVVGLILAASPDAWLNALLALFSS